MGKNRSARGIGYEICGAWQGSRASQRTRIVATQPPNHPPQHSSSHRFQIQLRQSFIEIVVPALSETRTLGSGRLARTPARLLGVTETPGRQFPRIPAWDLVVPLGGTAVPLLRAMLMYKKKVSATGGLSRLNRGCCIVSSCAPGAVTLWLCGCP